MQTPTAVSLGFKHRNMTPISMMGKLERGVYERLHNRGEYQIVRLSQNRWGCREVRRYMTKWNAATERTASQTEIHPDPSHFRWTPVTENGKIVSVSGANASGVTLDPDALYRLKTYLD